MIYFEIKYESSLSGKFLIANTTEEIFYKGFSSFDEDYKVSLLKNFNERGYLIISQNSSTSNYLMIINPDGNMNYAPWLNPIYKSHIESTIRDYKLNNILEK